MLHYTGSDLWCALGQPVRQASVLACERSMCRPIRERKKESHEVVRLTTYFWRSQQHKDVVFILDDVGLWWFNVLTD